MDKRWWWSIVNSISWSRVGDPASIISSLYTQPLLTSRWNKQHFKDDSAFCCTSTHCVNEHDQLICSRDAEFIFFFRDPLLICWEEGLLITDLRNQTSIFCCLMSVAKRVEFFVGFWNLHFWILFSFGNINWSCLTLAYLKNKKKHRSTVTE